MISVETDRMKIRELLCSNDNNLLIKNNNNHQNNNNNENESNLKSHLNTIKIPLNNNNNNNNSTSLKDFNDRSITNFYHHLSSPQSVSKNISPQISNSPTLSKPSIYNNNDNNNNNDDSDFKILTNNFFNNPTLNKSAELLPIPRPLTPPISLSSSQPIPPSSSVSARQNLSSSGGNIINSSFKNNQQQQIQQQIQQHSFNNNNSNNNNNKDNNNKMMMRLTSTSSPIESLVHSIRESSSSEYEMDSDDEQTQIYKSLSSQALLKYNEIPVTSRKLWSQEECCHLLELVLQLDPQSFKSKESENRWRIIANELGRTVTSTRKKYMRLMNKWTSSPSSSSNNNNNQSNNINNRSSPEKILNEKKLKRDLSFDNVNHSPNGVYHHQQQQHPQQQQQSSNYHYQPYPSQSPIRREPKIEIIKSPQAQHFDTRSTFTPISPQSSTSSPPFPSSSASSLLLPSTPISSRIDSTFLNNSLLRYQQQQNNMNYPSSNQLSSPNTSLNNNNNPQQNHHYGYNNKSYEKK